MGSCYNQKQSPATAKSYIEEDAKIAARLQQEEDDNQFIYSASGSIYHCNNYDICVPTLQDNDDDAILARWVCAQDDERGLPFFGTVSNISRDCLDSIQKQPDSGVDCHGNHHLIVDLIEDNKCNDDVVASMLQAEWNIRDRARLIVQCEVDSDTAQHYQEMEAVAAVEAKEQEEKAMRSSTTGRAVLLVNSLILQIQDILCKYPELIGQVEPFAIDDMVYFAEKLIELQEIFKIRYDSYYQNDEVNNNNHNENGIQCHELWSVDIGYHYTRSESLDDIRCAGLLTLAERQEFLIDTGSFHGTVYGDGVYTGSNPFAFANLYGDVGLMVARLKGKVKKFTSPTLSQLQDCDTICGNKKLSGHASWNEHVLQTSAQCIPLARYNATIIHPTRRIADKFDNQGNCCIIELQERLQAIVDEFLNEGRITPIPIDLSVISAVSLSNQVSLLDAAHEIQQLAAESQI